MMTRTLIVCGLLALSTVPSGCEILGGSTSCGEGTMEVDGECVASDLQPPNVTCGPGTDYDPALGQCVSHWYDGSLPCDPATTVEEVNDEGHLWCRGIGGSASCNNPPPCTMPDAGRVTVCGRLYDMETGVAVEDEATLSQLAVGAWDAIAIVGDPSLAPAATIDPDACGYFVLPNLVQPAMGNFLIASYPKSGTYDQFTRAGIGVTSTPGSVYADKNLYVIPVATDEKWTTSAGNPFGSETFATRGSILFMFTNPTGTHVEPLEGEPSAGVKITAPRDPVPAVDYYFSDAEAGVRSTVDVSLDATSTNGSGFFVGGALGEYGGAGGEPSGCSWPSNLAASIPNAVFVTERVATCL